MTISIKNLFSRCKHEFIDYQTNKLSDSKKPNILILCNFFDPGSQEKYNYSLYKTLLKNNFNPYLILPESTPLEQLMLKAELSFYKYKPSRIFKFNKKPGLSKLIYSIIKKHNIKIVHCNRAKDIDLLKKSLTLGVKTILTRHVVSQIKEKYLKQFDGIIGVNPQYTKETKQVCKDKKFKTKIIHMAPFFKEEDVFNFLPTNNKENFFKNNFEINLLNHPTISIIANILKHKNQEILLNAAHKLIFERNKPINILMCGLTRRKKDKKKLDNLSKKLKIKKYIHYTGFTDKRIEVIYHSDINILTSKQEAFGIVMLEAALLKKPLIGPTKTGIENTTIIHEKTGLIFENDNVYDLTNKIEILLDNPNLQKKYGMAAYKHVRQNFTSNILIKKLEKFYNKLI